MNNMMQTMENAAPALRMQYGRRKLGENMPVRNMSDQFMKRKLMRPKRPKRMMIATKV